MNNIIIYNYIINLPVTVAISHLIINVQGCKLFNYTIINMTI